MVTSPGQRHLAEAKTTRLSIFAKLQIAAILLQDILNLLVLAVRIPLLLSLPQMVTSPGQKHLVEAKMKGFYLSSKPQMAVTLQKDGLNLSVQGIVTTSSSNSTQVVTFPGQKHLVEVRVRILRRLILSSKLPTVVTS